MFSISQKLINFNCSTEGGEGSSAGILSQRICPMKREIVYIKKCDKKADDYAEVGLCYS